MEHHGTSLRAETDCEFVEDLLKNFETVLDAKDQGMIEYALKRPNHMKQADVERLFILGFSERDVFDINQITAYFNYVNRIASGLGVEIEND